MENDAFPREEVNKVPQQTMPGWMPDDLAERINAYDPRIHGEIIGCLKRSFFTFHIDPLLSKWYKPERNGGLTSKEQKKIKKWLGITDEMLKNVAQAESSRRLNPTPENRFAEECAYKPIISTVLGNASVWWYSERVQKREAKKIARDKRLVEEGVDLKKHYQNVRRVNNVQNLLAGPRDELLGVRRVNRIIDQFYILPGHIDDTFETYDKWKLPLEKTS